MKIPEVRCLLCVYYQGKVEFATYSNNGRSFRILERSSSRHWMFVVVKNERPVFSFVRFFSFCLVFRLSKSSL